MKSPDSLVIFLFSLLTVVAAKPVWAEQIGSSPESGTASKIKDLYSSATTLGFGSDSAGSFGNLGSLWNRLYSSVTVPPTFNLFNGGGGVKITGCTSDIYCFPQSVGGVEDYNNNGIMPNDTYTSTWTVCNSGNNYCGTGRSVSEKKDSNTGLVWSPKISVTNWFIANNCAYPNWLSGDDGVCDTNGEVACVCVKNASNKTGCDGYDDGNWRLPNEKELLMAYVDGGNGNLSDLSSRYWSSTTLSYNTHNAWHIFLNNGSAYGGVKTNSYNFRCVR